MMLVSEELVRRAGIEIVGDFDEWLPEVHIDSRNVEKGDLFWALRGEHQDGHEYVAAAFDQGAGICAVSHEWAQMNAAARPEGKVLFVMEETLQGMQRLAAEVRRSLGADTVAITGSNGKTTTRELVAAVLGAMGRTTASKGNYNNHIGLPLTLLNATGDEQYLVLEMGANHVGEIEFLCRIGHPEFGLITNIGDAHMGEFGGPEMVQKAKGELFGFLAEENGIALVNLDDDKVVEEARRAKRKAGYTLGLAKVPEDWRGPVHFGSLVGEDDWSRATLEIEGVRVQLKLVGRHWARAAVGAAAVALELGGDPETVLPALATVEALPGRGHVLDLGDGVELLDDSYNANVASIEAALATLARREGPRIAVLGDIHELGDFEEDEHRRLGRAPELEDIDHLIFVGPRMSWAAEEATLLGHPSVRSYVETPVGEIAGELRGLIEPGTGILVKGSRKMGLERLVNALAET